MTTKPTTETDAADNDEATEKVDESETNTEETEESETDSDSEEGGSNVTPREKELRRLLRENEKKLKKLEKADEERSRAEMTETEKLREELKDRDSELDKLRRQRIAAEHGLDEDLAERLRGVTEEELEADAKALSDKLGKKPKPKSEDVGIGSPGADEVPSDPVKAHRAAMAGRSF